MLIAWGSTRDQPDFLHAIAPDNSEFGPNILPIELEKPLSILFLGLEFFDSVTRLSLTLGEDDTGQIVINDAETTQDLWEIEMSSESRILGDIDDLGCPQFLESEVIMKSRVSSTRFLVQVESRTCIERKAAFATAGTHIEENGFHEFFSDLKLLCSVRACTGVADFVGVVLDDTRSHLKSFIHESTGLGSTSNIMLCAKSKSQSIPWSVRATWAKQIINAVSEVHSKGVIVGGNFHTVGVRTDGSAVITDFRTSNRHIQNTRGNMAPELRDKTLGQRMTFRMDVFHLTTFLWQLAEHIPHFSPSLFCTKSGCTKHPRSTCMAAHTNPVELPVCSPDVPSYFNEIIVQCRSPEPKMRPTARQLVETVSDNEGLQLSPEILRDIVTKFAAPCGQCVSCNECSNFTTDLRYHCNICHQGDFDLCPGCFEQGIHCLVPQHRLRKVTRRHGSFVEEIINDNQTRSED